MVGGEVGLGRTTRFVDAVVAMLGAGVSIEGTREEGFVVRVV